jgi:hypothetical protein
MPRLLPDPIEINGEHVSILVNNSKKGTSWFPLLKALVERLSMAQLLAIIYTRPRTGEKIINYDDVVDCFESMDAKPLMDYGAAEKQCICGVAIANEYWIFNKAMPNKQHRIGCECIKHWSEEEYIKIEHQKKRRDDPDATFCVICRRKNNKKSCGCNKQPLNDLTRTVFSAWRFQTNIAKERSGKNEKVGFGKFPNMMCYILLTAKHPQVIKFKKWIMTHPTPNGFLLSKQIRLQRYQEYIDENIVLKNVYSI